MGQTLENKKYSLVKTVNDYFLLCIISLINSEKIWMKLHNTNLGK